LAVTLYSLKKLNPGLGKSAAKTLNVTEVHHLGPRQKLMLVTVNKQQVLLGVTLRQSTISAHGMMFSNLLSLSRQSSHKRKQALPTSFRRCLRKCV